MFVEYARNAVRMAAVGEQRGDGVPTTLSVWAKMWPDAHQPMERWQRRVTPDLCHAKVMRDEVESAVAWKYGVERQDDGPTALILSRQEHGAAKKERTEEQLANIARGGYVLKGIVGRPQIIFICDRFPEG